LSPKPVCVNIPDVVKNLSFLILILIISGCSSSKKTIVSESLDAIPVITGSVVNSSVFAKGGTLVLGSFKPGPGAAANDETDKLSSMMIKGINDTLPGDNTHFTISTDDQSAPDCFLEGYIEDYGHDVRIPHLKLRKDQTYLSVDGDIWLRETGEKIFLFQTSAVIDLKTQDPKTMAYQIGVAIAHFIGKGGNQ
jgi:hypothetical protein